MQETDLTTIQQTNKDLCKGLGKKHLNLIEGVDYWVNLGVCCTRYNTAEYIYLGT